MKKVVIVMTYYDRQHQLDVTLRSIARSRHGNFEVVVVDDGSPEGVEVGVQRYPVTVLTRPASKWKCSAAAYNVGLYYAMLQKPDVVVIQNAECYHVGDVVSRAAEVGEQEYISFGCFSIDKRNTFAAHDITALLMANEIGASFDGQNAWYNHPAYRPVCYHFCAALTAGNMVKLNGFEERLMGGIGYEDDNLLARVRLLGLKIEITEAPLVVHQWHYTNDVEGKAQLVEQNKRLHWQIMDELVPRATHLQTIDL